MRSGVHRAPPGSWLSFAQAYVTATEVLDGPVPADQRRKLWAGIGVGQALTLIAMMLRDLDLLAGQPVAAIEAGWVETITDESLKPSLRRVLLERRRLLPPQLLLLAALEALEFCPAGDPSDDLEGVDVILKTVLGIAEDSATPRTAGEDWGGLDAGLAGDLLANYYFNHTVNPIEQLAWVEENWRSPWPQPFVRQKLIRDAGGQPHELFREATKTEVDDFAGVGVHLWVQAQMNRFVRFPSEFFDRLGIDRPAVDRFLQETSTDLAGLRADVEAERSRTGASRWAFHSVRRHPIVRLDNGEWLVLRVGFAIERSLGDVTYLDVRNYLRDQDHSGGIKRDDAFRTCLACALEARVVESLSRTFPGTGRLRRVFTERTMQDAWTVRKSRMPSVCDVAVDCGNTWILFDVTDRRIPEQLINGTGDADALDQELDTVLTKKKAKQFASTIDHIVNQGAKLAPRAPAASPRFVCIVVTPTGGLGWNPAVNQRAQDRLASFGFLRGKNVLPLAIMNIRQLHMLEAAVEAGSAGGDLLIEWRERAAGFTFEQLLQLHHIPLKTGQATRDVADRLVDDLVRKFELDEPDPSRRSEVMQASSVETPQHRDAESGHR